MPAGDELEPQVARLARLGRAPGFSPAGFERALSAVARGGSRAELLRRLLLDWTGVAVAEDDAPRIWEGVRRTHERLLAALGSPVSLQTALLHEFHSRLRLLKEPRLLAGRELSSLRVSAITDPLTGLYNRRFLLEHLGRELSRAERVGGVVSLLLMDLQGFKGINDRLGHPVGDGVLVRTASIIRDSLRMIDAGARRGGDEFVAVLPNTSLVNSLEVAERIRQRVGQIRLPKRVGLKVGLHYGVASYPTDGRTLDFLIKMGDRRLYDCRRYNSNPQKRRHPRFAVEGMTLRLTRGANGRHRAVELRDIGYGGLAFLYPGERTPTHFEGEIVQPFSSDTHRVSMKPVSVQSLGGGVSRVGCAYEH